ncbi:hypothetical protein GCM10007887_26740 [Methylobacterium haplocladii]|uniref:Uncharacterized protein n=2 Tax=Methylobacterium haplocladii TaxID=1176176 RepID=A0A512IKQ5_9HYPH|nr:hypothetical protein MHA02_06060 [Methylobacterium haplocladii]GJD84387.1 hypothetical protein HPGCJGGD_2263 [Methylobacterium haplocladii]GLS59998.1 hypothetical protein GCM10007887_26740 [Methylobacterium haplocladii]
MSDEPRDMTDVIKLCQELETLVGAGAPLRVRTLVEMLLIELERPMLTPRERPPATIDEP